MNEWPTRINRINRACFDGLPKRSGLVFFEFANRERARALLPDDSDFLIG